MDKKHKHEEDEFAELGMYPEEEVKLCRIDKVNLGTKYVVYIDTGIEDIVIYRDLLRMLRTATEADKVEVLVNSPGGVLDTGVFIANAILDCKAATTAIVQTAASAATLIALACDTVEVTSHSYFMLHNYSAAGMTGKGNELKVMQKFMDTYIESVVRDIYAGFLTSDEITKLLDGTDYWVQGKELVQRLKSANKMPGGCDEQTQ